MSNRHVRGENDAEICPNRRVNPGDESADPHVSATGPVAITVAVAGLRSRVVLPQIVD